LFLVHIVIQHQAGDTGAISLPLRARQVAKKLHKIDLCARQVHWAKVSLFVAVDVLCRNPFVLHPNPLENTKPSTILYRRTQPTAIVYELHFVNESSAGHSDGTPNNTTSHNNVGDNILDETRQGT